MNPDTIGCVWTGEFDLNTLRVDGVKFMNPERKSCGFKNIRTRVDLRIVGKKNLGKRDLFGRKFRLRELTGPEVIGGWFLKPNSLWCLRRCFLNCLGGGQMER